MSKPHKCPACDGWGTRPNRWESPTQNTEHCNCWACGATGIIWEYDSAKAETPLLEKEKKV